jgi:phage tail sheath gpL-like
MNVQVISPLVTGCLDIRWDDPSLIATGPTTLLTPASASLVLTGIPSVLTTATATVTIMGTPVPSGQALTIGGIALTSVAGPRTPGAHDFNGQLGSAALIAQEMADAINDAANTYGALVTASALGGVLTLTALVTGTAGNAITLVSTIALSLLSGATLTGGLDADTLQIGSGRGKNLWGQRLLDRRVYLRRGPVHCGCLE